LILHNPYIYQISLYTKNILFSSNLDTSVDNICCKMLLYRSTYYIVLYTYIILYLNNLYFQMVTKTKKIFVGGLSAQTTVEDVKMYFTKFGKVRTCPVEQLLLYFTKFGKVRTCPVVYFTKFGKVRTCPVEQLHQVRQGKNLPCRTVAICIMTILAWISEVPKLIVDCPFKSKTK